MSAGAEFDEVPNATKEEVVTLLSETLSPSQETREMAELGIKSLEVTEKFGLQLAEILVDPEGDLAVRQAASTTLQLYVETHWENLFNEEFEFPEIKIEQKEKIKTLLPNGLRDSTGEMRRAVAQTITAIARWDWPENWPGLYDVLIDCLSRENDLRVHEAMQVLRECIRYISYTQLPNIGPVILQAVCRIYEDENQYSVQIRSQAVEIFTTVISFLAIPDYCEANFIRNSILPVIPMFCEKFVKTLEEKNETTSHRRLKTEVIEAIKMLTMTLPKCISDFLPQMLTFMWEILADSAKAYQNRTENGEADIDDEDIHSDEDEMDDYYDGDTLLNAVFEFVSILIDGSRSHISSFSEYDLSIYHWFYLQDSLLSDTIEHLMILMEFTEKQISLWTHNPSRFLIEGEMDVISNSIRGRARNILIKIVHQPQRAAANALIVVILQKIQSEYALCLSGESRVTEKSWKSQETLFLAFCIAKNIILEKHKAETLNLDIVAFFENVVLADSNFSATNPFLAGRCLQLCGIYADLIPPEKMSRFLKATADGFDNQPACTKICAAMATNFWFRAASVGEKNGTEHFLKTHLPAMFEGLFDLGNQLMTAEGSKLVLESFAVLVSLDKTFTASVQSKICTLTIAAFLNFHNDLSLLAVCENIFRELSLHPECIESLQTRLVPRLVQMMTVNASDKPMNGKVAFEVLQILVEHSPQPLSSLLIETAFPASCNCILSSNDPATLQNGGKVVCSFVSAAGQQIISYKDIDNDNKTGTQYILQVAAKLLEPQCSDFRINEACEMVKLLLKSVENKLEENINMQQLLAAVLDRMQCTGRIFVRRLLMVFAHLINTQFDVVFNFLSNVPASDEQNTLVFVVLQGFFKEHEFFEQNDRKIVNLALSKVLEHGVTQNESQLHGAAAQETEDEVRTTVPLLVEICKLVSNELS